MDERQTTSNTVSKDTPTPSDKDATSTPSGFVLKLFQMVNGAPDDVISWVPSGDAFRISNLRKLENSTLPQFFRHSRFQSLVRQLNFYNFRKVNKERTFWVYKHPLFHRDRPEDLHLLRRRTCPGVDGRKNRESGFTEDGCEENGKNVKSKAKGSSNAFVDGEMTTRDSQLVRGADNNSAMLHQRSWSDLQNSFPSEESSINTKSSTAIKKEKAGYSSKSNSIKVGGQSNQKEKTKGELISCTGLLTSFDYMSHSQQELRKILHAGICSSSRDSPIEDANQKKRKRCPMNILSDVAYISRSHIRNNTNGDSAEIAFTAVSPVDGRSGVKIDSLHSTSHVEPEIKYPYLPHSTPSPMNEENSECAEVKRDEEELLRAEEELSEVNNEEAESHEMMESYENASVSDEPPRKRHYSIWPSSSGETDDDINNENKKQTREDKIEQSIIVSKVADQLREYAKRAAEANGLRKVGRGRRGNAAVAPLSTQRFGDTMKYHALTYDDEIYGKEELDEMEKMKSTGEAKKDDSATITGVVVTDESDNSEEDDSAVASGSSSTVQIPDSVNGKHRNLNTEKDCSSSLPHCSNSSINQHETPPLKSCFLLPPVTNPHMIASINRKLLHGIVGIPSHLHKEPGKYHLVSAAIAHFCMSTPPLDPSLDQSIEHLLRTCIPLAEEFVRYRAALVPSAELQVQLQSRSSVNLRSNRPIGGSIQEFKVFVVNWLENLLRAGKGLSYDEGTTLKSCVSSWMESTIVEL